MGLRVVLMACSATEDFLLHCECGCYVALVRQYDFCKVVVGG